MDTREQSVRFVGGPAEFKKPTLHTMRTFFKHYCANQINVGEKNVKILVANGSQL